MNDEEKKHIVRQMLNIVYGVSSKEYQIRVWLNAIGPECDSYDETICSFFSPAEDVIEKYKEFKLTEYQRDVLKEFWDVFYKFDLKMAKDGLNEFEFINLPEWEYVMKKAQKVIKAFKFVYVWPSIED